MAKDKLLEFDFRGRRCRFTLAPIKREMLYGGRRRIAVDEHGHECDAALLTRDGRFLLPAGSTASLYINDDGDAVVRGELVAIDRAGQSLQELAGEEKEGQQLETPIAAEELLDCAAHKVYTLKPESFDSELARSLAAGEIYRLPYRAGKTGGESPTFLLANGHGIFLLVMRPCRFEFVSLDQPVVDWDEDSNGSENDGDFSFDFSYDRGGAG